VLLGTSVAGNRDEIEARVELDLAGEVGKKDSRALQHSDEDNRLAGKVSRDARPNLGNFSCDLLARDQNSESIHGYHTSTIGKTWIVEKA
jgi:hypothetical protein